MRFWAPRCYSTTRECPQSHRRFLTTPRRIAPRPPEPPIERIAGALAGGAELLRSAIPHFAHATVAGTTYLYVGGQEFPCGGSLAQVAAILSGEVPLTARTLGARLEDAEVLGLVEHLVGEGFLEVVERDDS